MARLGPRTVGQLLDGGFDVVRFRFGLVASLAAVILAPFVAIPAIAAYVADITPGGFASLGSDPFSVGTTSAGSELARLVIGFVGPLMTMVAEMMMGVAIGHLVASWLAGNDPGTRDVLAVVRSRLWVALGGFALALLLKLGALMACGIGLLYAVPVLSLLAPVIAVENVGVSQSLSRTLALGRRRWLALLGIAGLWLVIWLCVSGGQQLAVATLSQLLPDGSLAEIVGVAAAILTGTFLKVISVSVSVLAYFDVRVRTEGFDLAMSMPRLFGDAER